MKPLRRLKYGNRRTAWSGRSFHSRAEADRAAELELLQKAGAIADLRYQVGFDLVVNGIKISRYYADFVWTDTATGKETVEDVKGFVTEVYRMKARLMKACLGIEVLETPARRTRAKRGA